jgi:hypothetical protein
LRVRQNHWHSQLQQQEDLDQASQQHDQQQQQWNEHKEQAREVHNSGQQQEDVWFFSGATAERSQAQSNSLRSFSWVPTTAADQLVRHSHQMLRSQVVVRLSDEESSSEDEGSPGLRAGGVGILTPTARQAALQRLKALRGSGPWAMGLPRWAT